MKAKVLTSTLLFSLFSSSVFSSEYCAGIRGNGELVPAHWTSMARIVEHKGMPSMTSGGSSAAVTQFLLDGISRNELVSSEENQKRLEQALMLKSLVPHIYYIINEEANAPTIMRMVGKITGLGDGGFIHKLKSALAIAKDAPTFFDTLGEYGPLLNPELAKGLKDDFGFYKTQVEEGLKVFGGFDARDDKNIFFRKGLVDFKFLGMLLGRIADFYAGNGSEKVNKNLKDFLTECSSDTQGKEWSQIMAEKPQCEEKFKLTLDSYYEAETVTRIRRLGRRTIKRTYKKDKKFPNVMIFEKVGSGLNALPTTSVVIGDAVTRYKTLSKEYVDKEAQDITDFSLDFDNELRYGYWGNTDVLNNVSKNLKTLFPNDTKSNKFMSLTGGSWFEVLGTSPAEPGLANILPIPNGNKLKRSKIVNKKYFKKKWKIFPTLNAIPWHNENNPNGGVAPFREGILSAGGWSDLHPTIVLKANGCDDIIYVTRQDGESVFGQQVFIRLTGYTDKISFWENIGDRNRDGYTNLTAVEAASPWNRLYNLGNPNSSFNKSIETANAVYCTDWNAFNVFKGEVDQLTTDAYNAPLFVNSVTKRSKYNFGHDSANKSKDNFPGCILK